jgi:hypothetical protein
VALLFMDGFGHLEDDEELTKWDEYYGSSALTYASAYGRYGDYGARLASSGFYYIGKNVTSSTTLIVGIALKQEDSLSTDEFLVFLENGSVQVELELQSNGAISVNRGSSTQLGISSAGVLSANTWHYIEAKVYFHQTAGTVDVKVDGASVLSLSSQDTVATSTASADGIQLYSGGEFRYVDDLYVCDATGSQCNDFLGNVKIHTLYPTSDGNSSDFTPASGSDNYAMVDIAQFAGAETDYVESSTTGHKDLYGVTTYSGTGTIHGVQVNAIVKNTDVGSMNVRTLCRSGATPADNEGSDFALTSTYKAAMTIHEQEPTDTVAWTASKVNAAEFGIKVQS